ncbi:MAG: hypothetical protein ABGY75_06895 [Gemmataceae bacterium]
MLKTVLWLLGTLLAAGLVFCASGIGWMGCTFVELEMELQVFDAATGHPIEGAEVEIISGNGFPEEDEVKRTAPIVTTRQTDANGTIHIAAGRRFATTSSHTFDLIHTIDVYRPTWLYRVTAPGYLPSDQLLGPRPEYLPQERVGRGPVKQIVRWRLTPLPAE